MTATAFQALSHALRVGTPVSIDLAQFNTSAASFSIINTNRAFAPGDSSPLLPPGLRLQGSVITGTPTTAGVTVCRARAYRGSRDAEASWNARIAGSYTRQRFDSAAALSNPEIRLSSWDQAIKRSGAGSMRQYIPANSGVNTYSKYFYSTRVQQEYLNDGSFASNQGFGRGEEFYLQYAFRPGYNFLKWPWATSSPKITIIDRLPPGTPTANPWEVVNQYNSGKYFYGYHGTQTYPGNSGAGWSINDPNNINDYIRQSAIANINRVLNGDNPGMASGGGSSWTAAQQHRAKYGYLYSYESSGEQDGRTDPLSAGMEGAVDQWHTILVNLKVSSAPNANDGRLRCWIAHEGQDYRLLVDRNYTTPMNASSPYFTDQGGRSLDTIFSGVLFNNLAYQEVMTGKPLTEAWIDEIICSPNFIQAPDFDGTGTYRTADVLLTFKVS